MDHVVLLAPTLNRDALVGIPSPEPTTCFCESGLTIILYPISVTDAVTVDVWVRTGGIHETTENLGISHFLEHMIFKGSQNLGPGVLDHIVEGRGGITNAATSQDYTHYYLTIAYQDLEEVLPSFADVILNAAIPDDEFERERLVVLEEIRRAQDNPDYQAYHLLKSTVYPDHSYGQPVLGTPESLFSLDPKVMRHYHQNWYQEQHITVVVVGHIEIMKTLELVKHHFQTLRKSWAQNELKSPLPFSACRVEETHPRLEQSRLLMAWPTVSATHWQEVCGLDLLASILGDGRTSRLVHLLREERGWARGISCSSSPQRVAGLFLVNAFLDPMYESAVEDTILSEIQKLKDHPVSMETLARAKRILLNEFIFSSESPGQLAGVLGYHDTITHWSGEKHAVASVLAQYLRLIHELTSEDLQRLAQRYLSECVVSLLRPQGHIFAIPGSNLEPAVTLS